MLKDQKGHYQNSLFFFFCSATKTETVNKWAKEKKDELVVEKNEMVGGFVWEDIKRRDLHCQHRYTEKTDIGLSWEVTMRRSPCCFG